MKTPKRFPVYLRPTPELRKLLENACRESGRTMAREMEIRIEKSFWFEDMYWRILSAAKDFERRVS